jgi:integrase
MSKWWLPALGRQLGAITPGDVRRVVEAMTAQPLAPKTVRTNLGVFSGVMSRAVEAEVIGRNPVRGIRLPDVARRPPRFLAGVVGLRWSEVVGLRVGAIDFLRRSINIIETTAEVEGVPVEHAPVKSKASQRSISVPVELIDLLAEHLRRYRHTEPGDLVFQAPQGGPVRAGNFRNRVWRPATQKVGLDGFTFHALPHSSVGFMVAAGAQPLVIQRRIGHASVSTTMDIYGQVLPEVDERVARDLGALFSGQSRGPGDASGEVHPVKIWGPDGVLGG